MVVQKWDIMPKNRKNQGAITERPEKESHFVDDFNLTINKFIRSAKLAILYFLFLKFRIETYFLKFWTKIQRLSRQFYVIKNQNNP